MTKRRRRRVIYLWFIYFHVVERIGVRRTIHYSFFLRGEGPRSRNYGRTAVLRLNVQPCDEDEDKR